MATLKLNEDELLHVTDLLLATANADGEFDGGEADIIMDVLESLVASELPASVRDRMKDFKMEAFDLAKTCQSLEFDRTRRDALFSLISRVFEADMVVDFDESDFLKSVAAHLGATASQIDKHLVKFIELCPPPR